MFPDSVSQYQLHQSDGTISIHSVVSRSGGTRAGESVASPGLLALLSGLTAGALIRRFGSARVAVATSLLVALCTIIWGTIGLILFPLARLKAGTDIDTAQAALTTIAQRLGALWGLLRISDEDYDAFMDSYGELFVDSRQLDAQQTQLDHNLATLYHHRGEVHEVQGREQQARRDKTEAVRLGYNPDLGIW